MRVAAVLTDNGQEFCVTCATEIAAVLDMAPWEVLSWEPLTVEDLAIAGENVFRAIRNDARDQYPDFVEANVDPFLVAQMDAVPYCEKCGMFLARLNDPVHRNGGDDR